MIGGMDQPSATSLFSLACLVSSPGELTSLFDGPTQSFHTVILTVPSAAVCYLTPQSYMRHHCHGQNHARGHSSHGASTLLELMTWPFSRMQVVMLTYPPGLTKGSLWCPSWFIWVDSLIRAWTTWRQTSGYVCKVFLN